MIRRSAGILSGIMEVGRPDRVMKFLGLPARARHSAKVEQVSICRQGYSSKIIGATASCRTDVSRLPRVMVASVITSEDERCDSVPSAAPGPARPGLVGQRTLP
jgi:hypothetical protein